MKEGCERCLSKFLLPLAFIVCVLGLSGCATTGNSYAQTQAQTAQANYEFMDRYDDLRLVRRNNDLYLEKLDGNESRRVTNTPSVKEPTAIFSKDAVYIVYSTADKKEDIYRRPVGGYYVLTGNRFFFQPLEKDDIDKKEITLKEFWSFIKEKR